MISKELKKMLELKNEIRKLEGAYSPLEKVVLRFLSKNRYKSYIDGTSHIKATKMDFGRTVASVDAVKMIVPKAVWDCILHETPVKFVKLTANQYSQEKIVKDFADETEEGAPAERNCMERVDQKLTDSKRNKGKNNSRIYRRNPKKTK